MSIGVFSTATLVSIKALRLYTSRVFQCQHLLTHRGSYCTMGETYRQLGAWVVTIASVIDQPVRELYVVSTDPAGNLLPDSELRTEIAWPIADQQPSQ